MRRRGEDGLSPCLARWLGSRRSSSQPNLVMLGSEPTDGTTRGATRMSANDEVDGPRRTPPASPLVPRSSRRIGLVLEYLRARDRFARPRGKAEGRRNSELAESKRDPG